MGDFDAVVLCGGSEKPRDLSVEGRDLDGVHYAMDFCHSRISGMKVMLSQMIFPSWQKTRMF